MLTALFILSLLDVIAYYTLDTLHGHTPALAGGARECRGV
jgi:hypothetical protein